MPTHLNLHWLSPDNRKTTVQGVEAYLPGERSQTLGHNWVGQLEGSLGLTIIIHIYVSL